MLRNVTTVLSTLLAANVTPYSVMQRFSLTGGTHTLRVAGFLDAGSGTFTAGAGTPTATQPNAYAKLWRA